MIVGNWHHAVRSGILVLGLAGTLAGCNGGRDWDLRTNASGTSEAALGAAGSRPAPDANGVISYPGYQVVVARQGDTVQTVAQRIGVSAADLARQNALQPADSLRPGEILSIPGRVASGAIAGGAIATTGLDGGGIDVATIASSAIDSAAPAPAGGAGVPFQPAQPGPEPLRHQVARGETAFTIARLYSVPVKDLADWNGLGPDFAVREGQYLLIPTVLTARKPAAQETAPGAGSPTPKPPSSAEPLPAEKTATATEVAKTVPPSPDLSSQRTQASASRFAMPVSGKIIRPYDKGSNDGVDIAAAAGTPVMAAADGTVAAVTKDTEGTPILVIRHADNMLTVYAGIEAATVAKGDAVKRGQVIGRVKAGSPAFLHFEIRQGVDSVDPMPYLQ